MESDEDVVTSQIKGLVWAIWNENRIGILILAVVYWIFAICMSFDIIFCSKLNGDECEESLGFSSGIFIIVYGTRILALLCYIILIIYEVIVFTMRGVSHMSDLDNVIDWLIYIIAIPHFVGLFVEFNGVDDKIVSNFIICLYLMLLGIRFVLYLRVFNGMRYLISMLI